MNGAKTSTKRNAESNKSRLLGLIFFISINTQLASQSQALELSFEQAQQRLWEVSDAIAGSHSQIENKRQLAQAASSLSYPELSIDVRQMRFKKHLELPLGSLAPVAQAYGIGDPLEFKETEWRFRPIVTAVMPIWTGGQVGAAQAAAQASVTEADAVLKRTQQDELQQLVQAYFGQQFAEHVLIVRLDVRDGLQAHFQRAEKLEKEGFATRAQLLQAKVALDNAERELRQAVNDVRGAQAALAGMLRSSERINTSTPLFIINTPLEPVENFIEQAQLQHPGLLQIRALGESAKQKVIAEQANWKPRLYAFGQYDLYPDDAYLTDPNWAFGVGVSYTLFSNKDRSRQVSAARSQQAQADYQYRDTLIKLEIGVEQSWLQVDSARQQFELLASSRTSAEENLRLQTLSFQEGQATSLDVIDARLQLGKVRIEQAQAAWQFDLALMQLLTVSGQAERFNDYVKNAEQVMNYE